MSAYPETDRCILRLLRLKSIGCTKGDLVRYVGRSSAYGDLPLPALTKRVTVSVAWLKKAGEIKQEGKVWVLATSKVCPACRGTGKVPEAR